MTTIAARDEDDECYCGSCGPCRRELKRIDAMLDVQVLTLETSAAAKAAREAKEAREARELRRAAEPIAPKTADKMTTSPRKAVAPKSKIPKATKAAINKDRRDGERVIRESEMTSDKLEESKPVIDAAQRRRERRAFLRTQLIEVDGYMFHPREDLKHGTAGAYADHGCRCPKCQEYGYTTYVKYREKKKDK